MSDLKNKCIFDSIAWIYHLFNKPIRRTFKPGIRVLSQEIPFAGKTVLDIGTGTGVWADLISVNRAIVTGIDHSEKMLEKAGKRYGKHISFILADAKNLKNFKDDSFDIVTASFVLHGMKRDKREPILLEMKRISKNIVAIYDYDKGAAFMLLFLDWLEKSDYYNFTQHFYNEFSAIFTHCKKIPVKKGSALYIGHKEMDNGNRNEKT
jgi:ubiquinone/menaquinone biosynthesis C-methylase UbiE